MTGPMKSVLAPEWVPQQLLEFVGTMVLSVLAVMWVVLAAVELGKLTKRLFTWWMSRGAEEEKEEGEEGEE